MVGLLALALPVSAAREAEVTIRLISKPVAAGSLTDRAPKGIPNRGDVFYAKSSLRNQVAQFGRPKGALVGSDYATYTLLSKQTAVIRVRVTLPGGTLRAQGTADLTKPGGVLAVVGGTGKFANARGSSEVRDLRNYSINVYRLQLPQRAA